MPTQQRLGLYEEHRPVNPRQRSREHGEHGEHGSVGWAGSRTGDLRPTDLVTEHQDFDVFVGVVSSAQHQQLDQAAGQ